MSDLISIVVCVFGSKQSGKSTLCLHVSLSSQRVTDWRFYAKKTVTQSEGGREGGMAGGSEGFQPVGGCRLKRGPGRGLGGMSQ